MNSSHFMHQLTHTNTKTTFSLNPESILKIQAMGHSHPFLLCILLCVGVALAYEDPEIGLRSRGRIEEEVVVLNPHKKELKCLESIILEKEIEYCSIIRHNETKELYIALPKCEIGINTLKNLYAANDPTLTSFLGFKLPIGASNGPITDTLFFIVIFIIAALSGGSCGLYIHWAIKLTRYCCHKEQERNSVNGNANEEQEQPIPQDIVILRRGQVSQHILGQLCGYSDSSSRNGDGV